MSEKEVTNETQPTVLASTEYVQKAIAQAMGSEPLAQETQSFDPALLLVKGKNGENKPYIKSLAHAIVTVIAKYGYANLKCVGASSVNNAIKSFTIASGEAKTHGLNLVLSAGFQNAMFDDVEKTAMVFKVFDR